LKRLGLLGLVGLFLSCGQTTHETKKEEAPEESRFVKEVFATNLFEPTELVVLPKGKVIFTQRRGGIKQYDLKTNELSDYDSIPVHHEKEDGLMGIALDPEFEQNDWVYLYYSPVGDEPVQHLSRFTYTAKGLINEVVMLKVPVQREECCHTGGSIQFGSDGLLYLSTGDNSNPFDSKGFSPSDERPGRSAWDAQKSSANTNDLRGKILRIKPEADGSYSIPEGNLFVDDDPLTKPEIYVMGCRNPYRISVDPKRGWLFWGDVGPDAGEDVEGRGPRGHDEFNVAKEPGFFGWPLFVGNNYAYNEYDFSTGISQAKYDPAAPVNNSPNNTGLLNLPPAQPAKIYYPYARTDIFPQVKNGGRNAMAGPVYYSDMYEGRSKFPVYLDGRVIYYDWMRGFIYFLELDEEGNPTDWYSFMPNTEFNNAMDMEFGPDGNLYMIEYGTGWFTRNENAKLSRIRYIESNRPPVLEASVSRNSGSAPLEVRFDASGSKDYDGDKLKYEWEIEGEVFNDSVFTYVFEKEGVYYPELTLSDGKGDYRTQQFTIEVGNEPPVVDIAIAGNNTFFWQGRDIAYEVQISDLEDEKGAGIATDQIRFDINHYQSTDMAEALGHQVPVSNGLTLIESLDCKGCHKVNEKSIGPSYTAVADRYRNDRNAVNYLIRKIISGGGGAWGEQAMSAHPDLTTEDAASIVEYILSLGNQMSYPLEGTFKTSEATGRYLFTAAYKDRGKAPLRPIEVTRNIWLRPSRMPADLFDDSKDIQARGGEIRSIYHGSWVSFNNLDLTGIGSVSFLLANREKGGTVSIRTGAPDGVEIGRGEIYPDRSSGPTSTLEIEIKDVTGFQNVYFVFTNEGEENKLLYIRNIEFNPKP